LRELFNARPVASTEIEVPHPFGVGGKQWHNGTDGVPIFNGYIERGPF
jgi:hypothetical protein